jgi:lysophospholipase L1-like esterase
MSTDQLEAPAAPRRLPWRALGVRLAFVTAALIAGLLVLEGVTRVVFDRNGMHYGIEMWKYAKYVKQRSSNAEMSHEHAPNRRALLMGVPVRTNSLGLRDREMSLDKTPGLRRLLVLGDSMTFGWGAAEEDTYPKTLERLLNRNGIRYEVINAGVGNYNSAQEVAYFTSRGIGLQPDELILGFYINDAEPTPAPNADLLAQHSYVYVLASSLWEAVARRTGLKPSLITYYEGLYDDRHPGWRACRQALVDLIGLCRREGIKLSIVLIPELHAPNRDYPFRRVHARIADIAQQNGVRAIDLLPAFDGVDPRSLWVSPGDTHPNARAHAIIAGALYQAMTGGDDEAGFDAAKHKTAEERDE